MLRLSKKLFQALALLIAFLLLCSGLVSDKITLFSNQKCGLTIVSQVTLSQWKESWTDYSLLLTLFLANFLFIATFLQIVAMVGLFLKSRKGWRKVFQGEPRPPPTVLPSPNHRFDPRSGGSLLPGYQTNKA